MSTASEVPAGRRGGGRRRPVEDRPIPAVGCRGRIDRPEPSWHRPAAGMARERADPTTTPRGGHHYVGRYPPGVGACRSVTAVFETVRASAGELQIHLPDAEPATVLRFVGGTWERRTAGSGDPVGARDVPESWVRSWLGRHRAVLVTDREARRILAGQSIARSRRHDGTTGDGSSVDWRRAAPEADR